MNRKLLLALSILICTISVGCNPKPLNNPARPVEIYLQSMVDQNETMMTLNTCSFWESNIEQDYDTFSNVLARTENLACSVISQTEGLAQIACEGDIIANYGGEETAFPLNARNYLSLKTNDVWQFCGYP